MQRIYSAIIWTGIILLIFIWLPLLFLRWLFDRNETRYKTGRLFRTLGLAISRVNPNWNVTIEGQEQIDDRQPYVMVSNHLSNADIPVISNLPWEMKWVAKKELFRLPIVGWMMKMAGDIPVDRSSAGKRLEVFKRCRYYLSRQVSVFFFPEGTRSRSGKLTRFSRGAFDLAIRENIPVLPIVLDGTQGCLPKNSWVFEPDVFVKLKVLPPVETGGYSKEEAARLLQKVRSQMAEQLAEWRQVPLAEVDATISLRQADDV